MCISTNTKMHTHTKYATKSVCVCVQAELLRSIADEEIDDDFKHEKAIDKHVEADAHSQTSV